MLTFTVVQGDWVQPVGLCCVDVFFVPLYNKSRVLCELCVIVMIQS